MITLRKATLKDLESIHQIETLSFKDGSYPLFVLRQFFDISNEYFYVAEKHHRVVGYALGNHTKTLNQGWILSLGVHPDYRGQNIGKQLTEKLVEILEYNFSSEICLTVHPDNSSAIKIYEALGFENTKSYDAYYGKNEPRLLLKKLMLTKPFNS
ncbi:ribosomal protein S18 acetylase RimI-like enzyme [Gelidibacter sediminis]|uniref:Ribosomal protein S18 acetylase RimI-like enzyme n=1 Tax=Gelidibacter sediminis TaxID=1608710 RepID=A0A4R7PZM3_9FLAO|nr:N-acetyltransferase [Gelidibacter sediminis]TDU40494.1 ribosomal protein S18 acetylase RimI-like enzyme [Gelidibacter sediminis]